MTSKAEVVKRQTRVRELLRVRATPEMILRQLTQEKFKVSKATLYRDFEELMGEDQEWLSTLAKGEFTTEYRRVIESLQEQIRQATWIRAQASKPVEKIQATQLIADLETTIFDLLAFGPTVVALRRNKQKADELGV